MDKGTYTKGIRGELSMEEINNLPKEDEYFKNSFKKIKETVLDNEIISKGYSGQLTINEINKLPKQYDTLKPSFIEWANFSNNAKKQSIIKTLKNEIRISMKIVDSGKHKRSKFSPLYWKDVLMVRKCLKMSHSIKPIYTEKDVTPQSEIEKMLVPSPGNASDPDWAHKCAINNVLNCKPNIPKENIITKIKKN